MRQVLCSLIYFHLPRRERKSTSEIVPRACRRPRVVALLLYFSWWGCFTRLISVFIKYFRHFCPAVYSCYTVYDGVYHTSLGRFSMLEISTVGIRAVPKRTPLEKSRRELSEDVSFGIGTIGTVGTLLVVEQSSLETTPGGVIYIIYIYTPPYTTLR